VGSGVSVTDNDEVSEVSGTVKWFDPVRGFGFVVVEGVGTDVLLHANVLRNFGQGSVADRSRISALVQKTDRGLQAVRVLSIDPPVTEGAAPISDLADTTPEDLAALPLLPARVKWFDRGKGFGFANLFGQSEDVFLHTEVLRHSGLAELEVGEAIALRVVQGRRGLMAAQIAPWDRAASAETPPRDEDQ